LSAGKKRVVALLAIRNEALYLPRCLEHLYQQGVETCVIDNDSTDESLEIAKQYMGKGVIRIERQPYKGYFDLVEQLRIKEKLAQEIEADWFIHHDADEIREAGPQFPTLSAALLAVGEAGYNAVNFDEFVFLPADNELEDVEPQDYVNQYRDYYFFSPKPLHRVNAWKKQSSPVDLVTMGGHQVLFPERRLYPETFILRHYIALSRNHLLQKYGRERVYSPKEIEERQWHGARARFDQTRARLPRREILRNLDADGWDRSNPYDKHVFFGE
jgi:glycosyltransferase involved in cell wall biosynthesis